MILDRLGKQSFPTWAQPLFTLCRVDPNIQNFIQRPGGWASIDWENSGWGDPAFDIATLMTHPAYLDVPASRWEWLVAYYAPIAVDATITTRILTYYKILLIWWLARIRRYLYEIPRDQDPRLSPWREDWQSDLLAKYDTYLYLAEQAVLD